MAPILYGRRVFFQVARERVFFENRVDCFRGALITLLRTVPKLRRWLDDDFRRALDFEREKQTSPLGIAGRFLVLEA